VSWNAEKLKAEDQAGRERGGWGPLRFLWVFGLVIVIYLLAPGPLGKMNPHYPFNRSRTLQSLYTPVNAARAKFACVDRFYNWYVHDVWKVPYYWAEG